MVNQRLEEVFSSLSAKLSSLYSYNLYYKINHLEKISAFFMNARLMHVIKFSLFFNVHVLRRCTFSALEAYSFLINLVML